MIALGLETSARVGSVALCAGAPAAGWRTDEIELDEDCRHARGIAPAIQHLLEARSIRPVALDLLVVGLGPGGYTGLRLGLATARTLCAMLGKPLLGLPSTAVLATHEAVPVGRVLAAIDARRGLVYGGLYEKDASGLAREIEGPFIRPAGDVLPLLTDSTFVAGDGLGALELAAGTALAGESSLRPRARDLLALGLDRHDRGEHDDVTTLLPLYLRPSEAEIRFDRLQAGKRSRQPDEHPGGGS